MRHLARTMRTRSGVAPPISQVAALLNGSVAVRAIQFLLVCSVVGDNAAAVGALDAIELILACGGFQPTPRPMRERSKVIGRRIRDSWQMLRRSESNRARTREYAPPSLAAMFHVTTFSHCPFLSARAHPAPPCQRCNNSLWSHSRRKMVSIHSQGDDCA